MSGGSSDDGDSIVVTFEDQGGEHHSFSLPHEAAGEIVWKVQALANDAEAKRHRQKPIAEIATKTAFATTQAHLQQVSDSLAVLVLRVGSVHVAFQMTPDQIRSLQEDLSHCRTMLGDSSSGKVH